MKNDAALAPTHRSMDPALVDERNVLMKWIEAACARGDRVVGRFVHLSRDSHARRLGEEARTEVYWPRARRAPAVYVLARRPVEPWCLNQSAECVAVAVILPWRRM